MSTMQGSSHSERVGFGTALVAIAVLVAGMWLLEGVDQASSNALDAYGIRPRTGEGLVGVFIAPWLHGGWAHLLSNTLPFLVLGIMVLLEGWRAGLRTTLDRRTTSRRSGVAAGADGTRSPWAPAASCSAGSIYLLAAGSTPAAPARSSPAS